MEYASEERLKARLQQNRRNAATLEATTATNEDGQVFTLAELAAKSTASKPIRRAELMTRIAGFERYADQEGHTGLFITLTCPSRFHRYLMVNNGTIAVPNPKYDPRETPRTGHQHLTLVWARARAAIRRRALHPYGFRISEPQHDGTPHWHLLVFCPAQQVEELVAILRKYALQDSGDEPGAAQHRCDFKRIDKAKGTAAGYIAKYVSKNIDGEHVGNDLEGRPATESAKRVEAWAATWRVRQFQQVGGAPVTVWRELHKVPAVPADAPEHLKQAHRAASKRAAQQDGDDAATVAWDAYCRAQGGMNCGRKAAIRLVTRKALGHGRYGDAATPRPCGVVTTGAPTGLVGQPAAVQASRLWLIESARRTWTIEAKPARRFDWKSSPAVTAKPARPWTRVNNCTAPMPVAPPHPEKLLGAADSQHADTAFPTTWPPLLSLAHGYKGRNGSQLH